MQSHVAGLRGATAFAPARSLSLSASLCPFDSVA